MDWRKRFTEVDRGYATPCLEFNGWRGSGGYGLVEIDGKTRVVHRQLWTESFGDPGPLHVCHGCDNPPCARLGHLFLGTRSENIRDAMAKGRKPPIVGSRNGSAKLTEEDVLAIRATVGMSCVTLGRIYGVTHVTISNVLTRKNWRHI